jgi:GNAT superfamily N-acetyltransferase
MKYVMESYPQDKNYHHLFNEVVSFLDRLNDDHLFLHFHWGRWEWMFARDNIKTEDLKMIKLFRDQQGKLRGILTFEDQPGEWFAIYDNDIELKKMIMNEFISQHEGDLIIPQDKDMESMLIESGYHKMDWIDPIAKLSHPITKPSCEGYTITSLEHDYRPDQIHYALWRGFNHGDDVVYSEQNINDRIHMTSSPHFKKRYTWVAIKDDHYVAYAGLWYLNGSKTALIEPVATVPDHRKKGLAGSCIFHAIEEAKKDGAQDIFVGSTQKFYYDLGFQPYYEAYRYTKEKK